MVGAAGTGEEAVGADPVGATGLGATGAVPGLVGGATGIAEGGSAEVGAGTGEVTGPAEPFGGEEVAVSSGRRAPLMRGWGCCQSRG